MKAVIPLILVVLYVSILCPAQEILLNSKKPLHASPGRTLVLTEVLRIKGEGEGYIFNAPRKFQTIPNGNCLFTDQWSTQRRPHLMLFSVDGTFVRDILRVGEGPGEIQSMFDFSASDANVCIYDFAKRKFVVLDLEGNLIKEWSEKNERFEEIIGIYGEWIVTRITKRPTDRKKSELYEEKDVLMLVSNNGESKKEIYTFTKRMFYISASQGGGMMFWDPFIATFREGKVFVCHSREYMIEVLDLESKKVLHRFSRDYDRIKHQKEDWEDKFVKNYNAPRIRYEQDIEALYMSDEMLWVKTSTVDDNKGVLFDLFNHDGIFTDSFYIGTKGRILLINGDFIYISEEDKDYLPYIVKYKIEDSVGRSY